MARFSDLETGFEKFLALAYGRHIVTGHGVLHSIGLETGGGTGKEVVLLSALGDGAYNEAGEGAWGIAAEGEPGEGEPECQTVTYASIINASSLIGGGAQAGGALTADPDWTAEPAGLTAEILAAAGDRFRFKVRSGHQRGLNAALYAGVTATNNYPSIWYSFLFDSFQSPLWWIDNIGGTGGVVYDDETNYSTDDVFEIRRNASNKAEFYRNDVLLFTTPEDIPTNSKLNVWMLEANAGVRDVQFCTGSGGSSEPTASAAVERVLYAGEDIQPSNYHYHPGTISTGDLDPIQGVDSYFPGGSTYSATPNIVVLLPEGLAEDADASKLAVLLKTSCIADYDINGDLISIGYSSNPARVKADMLKRRGQHTRINWASYVNARDYYDGMLNWEAGDTTNTYTSFSGVPTYRAAGNIAMVALTGAGSKPNPVDANDNHATTLERILAGQDGSYEIVVSAAFPNFTDGGSMYLIDSDGKPWFGISWGNGHFSTLANEVAIDDITEPYDFPASAPVTFELGVSSGNFYMKQNGVTKSFPQGLAIAPDLDLFGRVILYEGSAAISSSELTGKTIATSTQTITEVKRFEAHPAFTGPVDIGTALDYVDFLCASDTQDAGREIIFLTPEPRSHVHVFDEETNVVKGTLRTYSTDIRERPNRLWAKFRNLDLQFFDQDSVYDLRDELFERVGRPIDPGALNFASMSASQAQRLIKFYMRRRSDNYRWCDLTGKHDSVRVLPADVVRVLSKKYRVHLSTGYNAAATTVVLRTGDAAKFRLPPTPFKVTWWNVSDYPSPLLDPNREVVNVTNVVGDTLTIVRAQDGTFAADHNIAGKTYVFGRIPKDFLVITAGRSQLAKQSLHRPFKLQEYYPDDYRDSDHGAQQPPVGTVPPSIFTCPPAPVLELEQQTVSGVGGSVTKILGTVHFAVFAHPQSVRIFVTKEGEAETDTGLTVEPVPGTTTGSFEYTAEETTTYTFRAQVMSGTTSCGSATAEITIGGFIVDDVTGEFIIDDVSGEFIVEG